MKLQKQGLQVCGPALFMKQTNTQSHWLCFFLRFFLRRHHACDDIKLNKVQKTFRTLDILQTCFVHKKVVRI